MSKDWSLGILHMCLLVIRNDAVVDTVHTEPVNQTLYKLQFCEDGSDHQNRVMYWLEVIV